MLSNLKSIEIKGGFFYESNELNLFENEKDRISFIYGRNGTGKSSISNAFLALKTDDTGIYEKVILKDFNSNVIDLTPDNKNNIYIFNEQFVDDKIKFSQDGMNTIVMFGKQIEIEDELKIKTDEINDLRKKYSKLKSDQDEYNDEKNSKSPLYYKNLMINNLKSDSGWAFREQTIKQTSRKASVNESILDSIISTNYKADVKDEIKKLDENINFLKTVSSNNTKYPFLNYVYSINDNYELDLKNNLSKKIEKPILTEREKLIFRLMEEGYQSTIISAKDHFEQEVSYCPYCFQTITDEYRNEILSNFKTVLNENVLNHTNELKKLVINHIELDLNVYNNLDSKLCAEISNSISSFNNHVDYINNLIKDKINNVYVPITNSKISILKKLQECELLIKKLIAEINEYNLKVDNIKKTEIECQNLNKIISRNEINDLLKTYNILMKKCNENAKSLKDLSEKGTCLKKAIEELNAQKKNINIALKKINTDLSYIFFSTDRLSLEFKDDKYVVLSYGKKVELNKLSIGERNAIALCYFFAQILENTNEFNEYTNDFFLIIDDPISSFDFENKVGVFTFIRSKLNKILLNNKDNKVIIFTHEIEVMINFQKLKSEFNNYTFSYYNLYNKDTKKFDKFTKNNYTQSFAKMYDYVLNPNEEDDFIIGNTMRKVLEAFSTFQCKQDIESFLRDKDLLLLIPDELKDYFENLMYRLVLNGESHFGDQAITYPEGNFYEFVSREEKQLTSKSLLCFIYIINPIHVKKQLGDNKERIKNIELWIEELKKINN